MGKLTITASYDPSVTSLNNSGNATNQANYDGYLTAVNLSVQYFQTHFSTIGTSNVNLNIVFGFGSVSLPGGTPTVLNTPTAASGTSSVLSNIYNWSLLSSLMTGAISAPNATTLQKTAWNLVVPSGTSTPDPTSGGQFLVNPAAVKFLDPNYATEAGYSATAIDGASVLNSTTSWNWNQTNFTANQQDAVATNEHEISEVMGRSMAGGVGNRYSLMDFFDYTASGNPAIGSPEAGAVAVGAAAGVRKVNVTASNTTAPNAQTYFSSDGKTVGLAYTVPPSSNDIADWSSPANDAYGGAVAGAVSPISQTDNLTMQALGLVACFAGGTGIDTARGRVAVENLAVGDQVRTASGELVGVQWTGHREVDCARHPRGQDVWPVRVVRDAFAPGLPERDLLLSPDHAVFVAGAAAGVLIPVRYLINGATIRQEAVARVTYWHVELPRHDVLLAEGLPAESYLDTGNRSAFAGQSGAMQLHPDFARRVWETAACARLVVAGAELAAVRAMLLAQARMLGHGTTGDPALRLVVDGATIAGEPAGGRIRFVLPVGASQARLMSLRMRPAEMFAEGADERWLGVAVSGIALDGAAVPLDDARLGGGWHAVEPGFRWSDGNGAIDVTGAAALEVVVAVTGRYWHQAAALRQVA